MTTSFHTAKKIFIFCAIATTLLIGIGNSHHALAATTPDPTKYVPLAPIEVAPNQTIRTDLAGLIIDGFRIAVAGSAALAVIMIIIGGIQYMSTDAISGKKDGRNRIEQALFGLLLVMISFLVLQTINPKILDISLVTGNLNSNIPQPITPKTGGTAGQCTNTTGACFTDTQNSPGKICVPVIANGKTVNDCSQDITIDQTSGECAGKISFWQSQKPESVGGCYTNVYNDTQAGNLGKFCVVTKISGQPDSYDCSGNMRGTDVFNQDYSRCVSRKNYWTSRDYNVGGCYISGNAADAGHFCLIYTRKDNGVSATDCSGSLPVDSGESIINQNSNECVQIRTAHQGNFVPGKCEVTAETAKTNPGKFCIRVNQGGHFALNDCSGTYVMDANQCSSIQKWWQAQPVTCAKQ